MKKFNNKLEIFRNSTLKNLGVLRDVIDSRQINIFTLSIKSNRMVRYQIEIIDILYPNNGVRLLIKDTLFPDTFLLN